MGQIIAFPLPRTPYPDFTADLDKAESILLVAIRWWCVSFREDEDPVSRLAPDLETVGAADITFSINGLMSIVAYAVRRPVDIRCPGCPRLSDDEKHLLRAVSLTQAGDSDMAENVLRTTLLSAQGAELALGPLEGLSALFAKARLLLPRRRFPSDHQITDDSREAWLPPALH
jgi:hypothetical protein